MKKIILLLLYAILTTLTLSACREVADNSSPEAGDDMSQTVSDNTVPETCDGLSPPEWVSYSSLEWLLADLAFTKFHEARRVEFITEHILAIRELYVPLKVPRNFELLRIVFRYSWDPSNQITFIYDRGGEQLGRPTFTWHRNRSSTRDGFALNSWGEGASRAQHGTEFSVEYDSRRMDMTEQELYDFSYAQPVETWELQGNAISVSTQGMRNIRIFDEDGNAIAIEATNAPPGLGLLLQRGGSTGHSTLFRGEGDSRRVVGYRWRVDIDSVRWQYVLKSGTYVFHADAFPAEVDSLFYGEIGAMVRHFDDHEIVSEVDFTEELVGQDFSGFTIKVTPTDSSLFGCG
jgi:hypothetical protein